MVVAGAHAMKTMVANEPWADENSEGFVEKLLADHSVCSLNSLAGCDRLAGLACRPNIVESVSPDFVLNRR